MKEVAGKVAFVTGGASGIGFAMAKAFSEAGMSVVIADIRPDCLDEAMSYFGGARVHPIHLDVTDRRAMAEAANETESVFGKVHVLCNNAGVNLMSDIGSSSYDDWDWILGVNLGGVINGIQTFVPRIRAHCEGGHIVNTASMASFIASNVAGIYCASKFAVRGLSEALRGSLLPHKIGVSVLCPGLVNSAIHQSHRIRPRAPSAGDLPAEPEDLEQLARIYQMGMAPEEVARKVLRAIQRNDFYVFSHPEFKDELRVIFNEALGAIPDEPAPPERLAFEERRRKRNAEARHSWPEI